MRQTFTAVLMLVSSKLFPSNCNRIRALNCFHMIDERLKGLLRLKAHLAPYWGPISCPCAGSRAATMQMRRSLQWMPIMWNGCAKVLRTWQQGKAGNHFKSDCSSEGLESVMVIEVKEKNKKLTKNQDNSCDFSCYWLFAFTLRKHLTAFWLKTQTKLSIFPTSIFNNWEHIYVL